MVKSYKNLILLGIIFCLFPFAIKAQGPLIRIFDSEYEFVREFYAYDENSNFGVNTISGDFDGDGSIEIITAPQAGGGPQIKIFNEQGELLRPGWFAFAEDFRGGVNLAKGDVNGDKQKELIVSQASQGQAWIKVYSITKDKVKLLSEFLAYPEAFKGGCYITAGDIDGDKKDEIITGAGAGGSPQVRIFDGKGNWKGIQFFAFSEGFRGGVTVAAGNLNKNKKAEIVVGQASQGQAWVKIYKPNAQDIISEFKAYPDDFESGVTLSLGKIKKKKKRRIITGPGGDWGSEVKIFSKKGKQLKDFAAYNFDFRGKVNASFMASQKLFLITLVPSKKNIKGPKVALTFDDGYSSAQGSLDKILATLRNHHLKVTFFLLGDFVEKRPAEFQSILNENHEIGNHSYNHHMFTTLTEAEIRNEVLSTEEILNQYGIDPKPNFRYPGGSHNDFTDNIITDLGYRHWLWTAVANDENIMDSTLNDLDDGSIILFHCSSNATAEALDALITKIEDLGYNIVKVSELEN